MMCLLVWSAWGKAVDSYKKQDICFFYRQLLFFTQTLVGVLSGLLCEFCD